MQWPNDAISMHLFDIWRQHDREATPLPELTHLGAIAGVNGSMCGRQSGTPSFLAMDLPWTHEWTGLSRDQSLIRPIV